MSIISFLFVTLLYLLAFIPMILGAGLLEPWYGRTAKTFGTVLMLASGVGAALLTRWLWVVASAGHPDGHGAHALVLCLEVSAYVGFTALILMEIRRSHAQHAESGGTGYARSDKM